MRRVSCKAALVGVLALVLVSTTALQPGEAYSVDTVKERVVSPFKRVARWATDESQAIKASLYQHTHLTAEEKSAVEASVSRIALLADQLKQEEQRIDALHMERKALAWEVS
jgi:hypothetical protein